MGVIATGSLLAVTIADSDARGEDWISLDSPPPAAVMVRGLAAEPGPG